MKEIDELVGSASSEFKQRKFSAGLLIAMIDLLDSLEKIDGSFSSYAELTERFPRQSTTTRGGRAVTLILRTGPNSTVSLRPFYNDVERLFRATYKRYDYPSCAPHATQAWSEYEKWLDALCAMDAFYRQAVRQRVVDMVLMELPSQEFDPESIDVAPPLFEMLLQEFNFAAEKGEPSGAAFQGTVFGFIRADNPHLQVEIDKARTGSKRLQRVGDIDAWDGERLAITAEAKQYVLDVDHFESHLSAFVNEANKRGAIGLVVATEITDLLRTKLAEYGIHGLGLEDLRRIVALWDPAKQRIAVESLIYYAVHVEKNSVLGGRLKAFIRGVLRPSEGG